jgi:FkbM family methyltransferase
MFGILKKLIPLKIKLYLKSVFYFFLMHIKNADNQIVHLYIKYNQKEDIRKIIKIKFFNNLFFIPKSSRSAYVIQRTEKEKPEIEIIHKIFSKPSTYIDIGANIGYWTYARNYILNDNITFYCFEPSRLNFMYLQKNLDKFENIKVVNCGLSNKSETKTLSFPHWEREGRETNTGTLSLYGNTNINSENVKLITLDSYFKNQDIQGNVFIKIDTEGHEFQVLEGSQQFLIQDLNIILQLELNFGIENALNNNNIQNSIKLLTNLNYEPCIINNSQIKLLSENEVKDIITNKMSMELYFRKSNHKVI